MQRICTLTRSSTSYRHGSITSEMQRSNDIFKKQLEDPRRLHTSQAFTRLAGSCKCRKS